MALIKFSILFKTIGKNKKKKIFTFVKMLLLLIKLLYDTLGYPLPKKLDFFWNRFSSFSCIFIRFITEIKFNTSITWDYLLTFNGTLETCWTAEAERLPTWRFFYYIFYRYQFLHFWLFEWKHTLLISLSKAEYFSNNLNV